MASPLLVLLPPVPPIPPVLVAVGDLGAPREGESLEPISVEVGAHLGRGWRPSRWRADLDGDGGDILRSGGCVCREHGASQCREHGARHCRGEQTFK